VTPTRDPSKFIPISRIGVLRRALQARLIRGGAAAVWF
jgi:hypothetical protein